MKKLMIAAAFGLASLATLAGLGPVFAFDSPKALLEALYSPYGKGDNFDWESWDESQFRSKALNTLFEKDTAESGGMGRLDFDPYIDGQDYKISKLKIGEPVITGDTAEVVVSFDNFDVADTVTFTLVKEAGGWKVDDVVNANKDFPYSLKAIMSGPLD